MNIKGKCVNYLISTCGEYEYIINLGMYRQSLLFCRMKRLEMVIKIKHRCKEKVTNTIKKQ